MNLQLITRHMFGPRLALVLLALLVLTAPLGATVIVALVKPDVIVLGADSMRVTTPDVGRGTPENSTACKLGSVQRENGRGPLYFVLGGWLGDQVVDGGVTRTAFSTETWVRGILTKAASVPAAHATLAAQAKTVYNSMRDGLANQPSSSSSMLLVLVAGVDQGELAARGWGVVVTQRDPFTLGTFSYACPGINCGNGFWRESANREGKPPTAPQNAAGVRLILQREAQASPLIRAPFDVLEITRTRAKWINRDPTSKCPLTP